MSQSTDTAGSFPLLELPDELIQVILDLLPNKDIKNARLANKRLRTNSLLRFGRVFISPNRTNIDVLRSVISHKEFSRQVKEIVWDDTTLQSHYFREWKQRGILSDAWKQTCRENPALDKRREACDSPMTEEESAQLHESLYEEQEAIVSRGENEQALREALMLLPALQRIIVSTSNYEWDLDRPRYMTPMKKAFPPTFNYPSPINWPGRYDGHDEVEDDSWDTIRSSWRGLTIVLREVARHQPYVPELIIDVGTSDTGIPHQFFIDDSEDLQNFQTICESGLQRLDLPLHVAQFWSMPGLTRLPNSHLKRVLAKATAMRSFSLRTNYSPHKNQQCDLDPKTDLFLLSVIPIQDWRSLQHLSLSHFPIAAADFAATLKVLPACISSVEFVDLTTEDNASWKGLVQYMKDELKWTAYQPRLTMAFHYADDFLVWCTAAFAKFFAGEGVNPIAESDQFEHGVGAWARHEDPKEEGFEW